MKIYIGEFEGNHWAVESEREEPLPDNFAIGEMWDEKCEQQYYSALGDFQRYLASLPRILCSDSLVRGLKVGEELPPHKEEETCDTEPCYCMCHRNPGMVHIVACCDNGWIKTNRRIMLVPVEAKQEQEELWDLPDNMLNAVPAAKPQDQGEDELWERAWEESCKYEYYDPEDDRFLKTRFFDYLKSKFTITRKG